MAQFYLLDSNEFYFPGQHAFNAGIGQYSTAIKEQPKVSRWIKAVVDSLGTRPNSTSDETEQHAARIQAGQGSA